MTVPLGGVPLAEHAGVYSRLSDAGFTDVWTSEVAGTDAFTPLALAAAWSPGLRLGTAIAPVFTRGPGLLAMTAAALAETAPGRFRLGIGASSPVVVGDWNAIDHAEPYARCHDVLRFLRAALAGETVTHEFKTFAVRRFRLERPPAVPPRIDVAALRPGMLRLAAREADGVILNWLAATDVSTALAELTAARPANTDPSAKTEPPTDTEPLTNAGPPADTVPSAINDRPANNDSYASTNPPADSDFDPGSGAGSRSGSGSDFEVTARVFVCPTDDIAHARSVGRRMIASYLTVPAYADFHRWLGRGDLLEPMWQAWAAGDRKAALAAIPDRVVDDLIVHGSPAKCRAKVEAYVAAGVTTPVMALLPTPALANPQALPALLTALGR